MRLLVFAGTLAALLAACASQPIYRGATYAGGYGYAEQPIEADRYRVTFTGRSSTELETVDNLLLYRAAELTLERGFDHFVVVDRDTETEIQTRRDLRYPYYGSPYGFHHRYWHPRFGWYHRYDPFWDDRYMDQITQHEAQAEILLRSGPAPDTARAYDARQVMTHLGPLVRGEALGVSPIQ
jgi:hypothetical protein